MEQTIYLFDEPEENLFIKINPVALDDIIEVLNNYKSLLPKPKNKPLPLSAEKAKELEKQYLKGVSIKDLAFQYNRSKEIIEEILFERGLPIVDNNLVNGSSKKKHYWTKRKR